MALRGTGGSSIDGFIMNLMDELERVKSTLPEGLAERGKVNLAAIYFNYVI
jgi:hypothetical protein